METVTEDPLWDHPYISLIGDGCRFYLTGFCRSSIASRCTNNAHLSVGYPDSGRWTRTPLLTGPLDFSMGHSIDLLRHSGGLAFLTLPSAGEFMGQLEYVSLACPD